MIFRKTASPVSISKAFKGRRLIGQFFPSGKPVRQSMLYLCVSFVVFFLVFSAPESFFGLTHDLFNEEQVAFINKNKNSEVTFLIFDMPSSKYFYYESDAPQGTAIDIGELFTEKTGIKVNYKLVKNIYELKDELRANPLSISFLDSQENSGFAFSTQGITYTNKLYAKKTSDASYYITKDMLKVGYIDFDTFSRIPASLNFRTNILYTPFETFDDMYESYKQGDIDMFIAPENISSSGHGTYAFLNDVPHIQSIAGDSFIISVFDTILEKKDLDQIDDKNTVLYNRCISGFETYISDLLNEAAPVRIGFYNHHPYYFMMDGKSPYGVFIHLFNYFEKTFGLYYTAVGGNYSDMAAQFENNELDMIIIPEITPAAHTITVNRTSEFDTYDKYVILSGEYNAYSTFDKLPLGLVPKNQNITIGYSDSFRHYIDIGEITDTDRIRFVYFSTNQNMVDALKDKTVDYILFDEYVVDENELEAIEYKGIIAKYSIKAIVNTNIHVQQMAEAVFNSDMTADVTKAQYLHLLKYSEFLNILSPSIESSKIKVIQTFYFWVRLFLISLLIFSSIFIIKIIKKHNKNLTRFKYLQSADMLTKLMNRYTFIETVNNAVKNREPFLFFLLCIDNLKQINLNKSYQEGDETLIGFGKAILSLDGEYNITAARLDGNEFAFMVKYEDKASQKNLADSLMSLINRQVLSSINIPITTSAGISSFPDDGLDFEILYRKADEMLVKSRTQNPGSYNIY